MKHTGHILTVDLEDWFHLLDNPETKRPEQWSKFESRIESNTDRLLTLFKKHKVRATFFVLGWVAENYPELIIKIKEASHEIGCHSYSHPLIYDLSPKQFEDDLVRSLSAITDAVGGTVLSYRAPGFSVPESSEWFFEILSKNGIECDSSIFPAVRSHGGQPGYPVHSYEIKTNYGVVKEYPISVTKILGHEFCFSGGGYFRLLPLWFISRQFIEFERKSMPVVTYFHPRDFDTDQPRLKLSKIRAFKTYCSLDKAYIKLDNLLCRYDFRPFN